MNKKMLNVAAGETIFTQGAETEWVYHLLEGRVSLWTDDRKLMELEPIHILGLEGCYNRRLVYGTSARAETPVRLQAYALEHVPDLLFSSPRLGRQTLESLTRQLEWTRALVSQDPASKQKNIFFAGEIQTFGPGDWVIREDEDSTEFYRIIAAAEGLEVSKQGKVLSVIREPGEFFGEMAAVTGSPRTASVLSLGNSILEVYPGDILDRVIEDYPDMARRIITSLSQRLAETNRLLTTSGDPDLPDQCGRWPR